MTIRHDQLEMQEQSLFEIALRERRSRQNTLLDDAYTEWLSSRSPRQKFSGSPTFSEFLASSDRYRHLL